MVMIVVGTVRGKVQGVWFRRFVTENARSLNVAGYAKNLDDGRVEVLLCGSEHAVEWLKQQVEQGPPLARVDGVEWRLADDQSERFTDFTVR
ncbi:MAG: acylphosphatase [Porticoccaceae bacterium]|nr:acylphosphatase [Porticoccaceae bacterium]